MIEENTSSPAVSTGTNIKGPQFYGLHGVYRRKRYIDEMIEGPHGILLLVELRQKYGSGYRNQVFKEAVF